MLCACFIFASVPCKISLFVCCSFELHRYHICCLLSLHQVRVTLLEARARIGGRVHTDRGTFGHAVELGAQFIHGAAQNPLSAVANSFGLVRCVA
jgi:hypothetical protein